VSAARWSADVLSAAAEELSVRSSQTSVNAQTQIDKINQIAAAAEEMTATIGEISHNAETAAMASRESAGIADQGGTVMQAAASGEISESAGHISSLATENMQAAEDTAEACKSLSELANDLDGIICQFRIDDETQKGGKIKSEQSFKVTVPALRRTN
jgi:methyl-accepting chemotaxis protein